MEGGQMILEEKTEFHLELLDLQGFLLLKILLMQIQIIWMRLRLAY